MSSRRLINDTEWQRISTFLAIYGIMLADWKHMCMFLNINIRCSSSAHPFKIGAQMITMMENLFISWNQEPSKFTCPTHLIEILNNFCE